MRRLALIRLKETVQDNEPYLHGVFKDDYHKFDNLYLFVYLGEIPNMPSHCVIVGYYSGRVYCGYHTEDFEQMPNDW